jgi:phosphoribosylformylglycinamidine synthase
VAAVRVGKSFDIELEAGSAVEARERLEAMCQKLLANQVMEEYEIHLEGEPGS